MTQEKFSYSTQPHAAPMKSGARSKYRDDDTRESKDSSNSAKPNSIRNLMYDARVIRGNTYSKQKPATQDKEKENDPGWSHSKARTRDTQGGKRRFTGKRGSTPPPLDGRAHMDMQTEEFLEELTDRPVQVDADSQTLPFADRPPSPLFVRSRVGQDAETQVLTEELFSFDLEVEPVLEVLVGRSLHVSMLEVLQEEELLAIRLQQEEFEAIRDVEIAEVQRLEAELKREIEEKQRRVDQEKARVVERRNLEEKIAARGFSQQYLGQLHRSVFEMLEREGVFYDPLQREVESVFLKDVVLKLQTNTEAFEVAQCMAEELIEAARARAKVFEVEAVRLRKLYYEEVEREEAIAREAMRLKAEEEARIAAELAAKEEQEESDD